jgi:hypothetical protein
MATAGNFPSKAESEQRWEHAVLGGRRVDGQAREGSGRVGGSQRVNSACREAAEWMVKRARVTSELAGANESIEPAGWQMAVLEIELFNHGS